ncbi:hypothetical protein BOTBODRAFT_173302 [Botryobasidium botryosum FD-172 SS1]|uniref:Uncharacterized protein n=1 Tax=Botryobasidium botryosum (strain FD-172 SS1) TaxID=930990 RepID=A0A067MKD6_BOTB1|nr:hypothetical protein BOTBODRAFT_173302 [Botryobasidium botryosum FD-172 SS1]
MTTHSIPVSAHSALAHQPASTASPIAASFLFLFKLIFSFSFTSICSLVVFIRWILCSFFKVVCAAFFNGDNNKAAAPQAPISFPRVNEAPVLVKTPTTAPWVANITHQARSPASIRRYQAPIYAPSSRFAPLAGSTAPRYGMSPAPRTVDADKARRGPVAPVARSNADALKALGQFELLPLRERRMAESARRARVEEEARVNEEACAKEEARVKEEEVTRKRSRQLSVVVNDPALAQDVGHAPAAIRAPPYAEVTRPSPVLQPSAAIDGTQADVSSPALSAASLALCPALLEPYSIATDDMECDERPVAPEPIPVSTDDVLMDIDPFTSPEECVEDTPSLLSPGPSPSPSSMPPITPPAVFPRGDFFDVMITSCEDDELVNSLRACTLSCLHPMLPPMDVEPDAPVAEVTLSLSECSLVDAAVLAEMDVDEDAMVVCGDDESSPVFLVVGIDDADQEDTQVIDSDDSSPAVPSSVGSMHPSTGPRSRLVKRHKRRCARVDIPSDFSAVPTPKPKLVLLRLVEKYADLGLDKPGVVFRVKLDVGVRKVERDSRSA